MPHLLFYPVLFTRSKTYRVHLAAMPFTARGWAILSKSLV